ncbi:MAG: translocation/assembly module TamB [Bacteroidales bacterium]|nr:translocation/assembly module TamB [Bacteroidales bacterium]
MIKKIVKILNYILISIVGLLLILLLLIHTGSLNSIIKRKITKQVSNQIQGELTIASITGSLFNRFTLHEVRLLDGDSILLNVKSIRVSYSLPAIIRKRLLVHHLELNDIGIQAIQQQDSRWNILNVLQPVQAATTEKDTSETGFLKSIELSDLRITALKADINSQFRQETIPKTIEGRLALKFLMKGDQISVNLQQFKLRSFNPDLEIRNMSGNFSKQGKILQWKDFILKLTETNLTSSGTLPLNNPIGGNAEVWFSPLDLSDFHPFMTGNKIYGSPDVEINYGEKENKQQFSVDINTTKQTLQIHGWLEGLNDQDSYYLQVIADRLNGATWTRNKSLKTLISGTMEIEGTGFDFQTNTMEFNGKYDTVQFSEYAADKFHFQVNKTAGTAKGKIEVASKHGQLSSRFTLSHLFDTPTYDMTASLKGFDISSFIPESKLHSDLNLLVDAKGHGVDLNRLKTAVNIQSTQSQLLGRPIDNFATSFKMNKGDYLLKKLNLNTPFFSLNAEGEGNIENNNNISFQFEPYNLNPFLEPYGISNTQLIGQLNGTVSGHVDAINLTAELALSKAIYDSSIAAKNLRSTLELSLIDSNYHNDLKLSGSRVRYGNIHADSLYFTTKFSDNKLDNFLFLKLNDSVRTDFHSRIEMGAVPTIYLQDFNLRLNQSIWQGGSDSTYFALGKDTIRVNQLQLTNGPQSLNVNGRLAFKGEESLQIEVRNLDLKDFDFIMPSPYVLQGLLTSNIYVQGTAQNPELRGKIQISNPGSKEIVFKDFQFDMNYQNELLTLQGKLEDNKKQVLHTDIKIPLHISFLDSTYLLKNNDFFHAALQLDSLNTKLFNPYLETIGLHTEGYLSTHANISNTMHSPAIEGGFIMQDARVKSDALGVTYKKIKLDATFSNKRITLNNLKLHSGEGYLQASGHAGMDLLNQNKLKNMDIQIAARDFKAITTEKGEAVISSNFELSGPYNRARFDGRLTILQSTINTDLILAESRMKSDNPNPPLLIQAMKDTLHPDSAATTHNGDTIDMKNHIFYNNLSGTFEVQVPGNTWIKGKDMNFELKGQLRAVKEGPQFDLFGDLSVNRGYYKFYGKRFSFNKGKLSFTGGREINPVIDFEVTYSFRDVDRKLRHLTLHLTGRALTPDIRFTMDKVSIEEKEAIGYILFGRRLGNLTNQQSASVEKSTMNLTKDIALGQISYMLKDALQSSLQLDVVEISGGNNLRSGKVTVGKYITNDLYLRYEQSFAFDKKNKIIEPEEIALEYQIIRSLFIQATNQGENSGFDLIYKKNWK